ncbi:hypothetical protein GCM10023219_08150 [Stakelama sediminis]|uniref:GNAT superfamily N-acetyltransferase n=1 Tax=Stakelama sediminis TaxID=463200 RepID=A0A840YVE2_9SPHN|nr:GNAT family N-acetyltransferase [Stakelama sediminis]MBB5717536.1 GNAT superfamily N-acetyltransferase [Stakelama sediminis]
MTHMHSAVDPDLFHGWTVARSVSRALPVPVADHGGWRVDTNSPVEFRRYFFAAPSPEITALADSIVQPRIFLKLCATTQALGELTGPRWTLIPTGYWMTRDEAPIGPGIPPDGFILSQHRDGDVVSVTVHHEDGTLAASGYAAETAGVYAYDRIVTNPDFRRLGLARAVMAELAAARRSPDSRHVLVASQEGQPLYASMGWATVSPYATAVIESSGD